MYLAEESHLKSPFAPFLLVLVHSPLISYIYPKIQVLAAVCVCLTSISFGANNAITSAVIFAFQKDSDEKMKMTLEEASWLRKSKVILVHQQAKSAK